MKRKLNVFRLLSMLIFPALLMACNDANKDMEEMIPENATGVVCFNVPNMLDKGGISEDDDYQLPVQLKEIVSKNEDAPICEILTLLPKCGLDLGSKVYMFFSNSTFGYVVLASIDDEDATKEMLERQTGEKFKEIEGIDYLRSDAISMAIYGKTLFVGREKHELEDSKLAFSAKMILTKQSKSLFARKEVKANMKEDSDISLYLDTHGIDFLIKDVSFLQKFSENCPLVALLTDSDIEAFVFNMKFDQDGAKLNAAFKADKNSDFYTLLDATVSKPDDEFLKAMPTSMNFVMALSVKGEDCLKLDQVRKSVNLLCNLPEMEKLDFRSIVKSIDGPIAIGLSPSMMGNGTGTFFDNYNISIAVKTKDTSGIIDQVKTFAKEMGQEEYCKNDYYVYDYEGLPLLLGAKGDYVYVMRLDHELLEDFYYDYEDYRNLFTNSSFAFFINQETDTIKTLTSFSSNGKIEGNGVFLPINDGLNPVVAFWALIANLNFSSETDGYDDYDFNS